MNVRELAAKVQALIDAGHGDLEVTLELESGCTENFELQAYPEPGWVYITSDIKDHP